jgi:hypothetical protein
MGRTRILVLVVMGLWLAGCGTAIRGRLVAVPDGKGVAGARVVATLEEEGFEMMTESRGSGRFALTKLRPGVYDLFIACRGFVDQEYPGVQVEEGKTARVQIEVLRQARVLGQVTGPEGQPMPEIEVLAGSGGASTSTDAEGRFVLEFVDPGPAVLFAVGPDHASGPVEVELAPGDNTVDLSVREIEREVVSHEAGLDMGGYGAGHPIAGDGAQ